MPSLRSLIPVCFSLCLAALPAGAVPTLPDLGDPGAQWLTPEQQFRMGRAWLRQMRARVPVLSDPLIQEYTENLTYRLASHSELKEPDLAVVVINNRNINAFAVPGGVIGLNAGLFLNAGSEDEVGAVIAHELAHVSQHHFSRRYADSQRMNRAVLAAMLASIAVALAGDAEAGMAGMAATQAAAIQSQLAYSRHHEREADRLGMQTLVAADMDPQAMPRFFERLLRKQQYGGDPPEFLLTHPLTEERVADSRARAASLKPPLLNDSLNFRLIQARIRAGFIDDPAEAVAWFRDLYSGGTGLQQLAAGYGLARALTRAQRYDEAEEILKRLRDAEPNQLWFRMEEAELAAARGDHGRAVSILREVLDIMPGNYAAGVLLSRNLLAAGHPEKAEQTLDLLVIDRPQDPVLWQLLADAHGHAGNKARAHRARGEFLFLTGREEKGIEQMGFALDASKDDFALHSRVKARVKEMEQLKREAEEKF